MKDFRATAPHYRVLFLRFEDAIVQEFPCEIKDLALRDGAYDQMKRWKRAGYFCYGFLDTGVFDASDLTIEQASALIKNGKNPVVVHAHQVSVQDQLDLVELQIAIQATRYQFPVPPLPGRDTATGSTALSAGQSQNMQKAFARGRERALIQLRSSCRTCCAP